MKRPWEAWNACESKQHTPTISRNQSVQELDEGGGGAFQHILLLESNCGNSRAPPHKKCPNDLQACTSVPLICEQSDIHFGIHIDFKAMRSSESPLKQHCSGTVCSPSPPSFENRRASYPSIGDAVSLGNRGTTWALIGKPSRGKMLRGRSGPSRSSFG